MKVDKNTAVKTTQAFKLKDRNERNFIIIDLKETFGFVPEGIIITKIRAENNTFNISAIVTPDEKKKNEKEIKELKKEVAKNG